MTDLLDSGLDELEWTGDRGKVRTYLHELETWNERFGLVSVNDPDDLVVRHLLDSLAPWKLLRDKDFSSLADLGSGAGFPGIPLAFTFPGKAVTLVERMEKRTRFLEATLAIVGRGDVRVLTQSFEEVKQQFDVVTFRAFSALEPKLVKKLRRLLTPRGVVVAYKGRRATIDAEVAALAGTLERIEILPVRVPHLDEERNLVIFR